tara:strand:+ start:346 stop:960 length:615 start_codon:yes stop_codon:yes gene_type:complete
MWALVEDNNVTQVFTRPKAITIGDNQYPSNIMSVWSAEDLEAIGIYEVVIDNTNLKDKEYYINTNQSFDFADGTVTASYGTATAKSLDDALYTAQDETDGLGTEGEVKTRGLKYNHKQIINAQAGSILLQTDWYRIREADGGTAVPSNVSTHRTAVRTKANAMCEQIDGAADVDALAALYEYTNTGTEEEPVFTRPLGEFPELD